MNPEAPRNEVARLAYATRNSLKGYARVFRDEAAFRMQVTVLVVAVPVALWLARSWFEFAVLVASWALVLAAELGNSAIEAVVDRVGREEHDLAGKAWEPLNNPARSAFCRKSRRSCGASRVTVAVATAEDRNARDAAFPAKPEGTGLCGRSDAFCLAYLEQPNRTRQSRNGASRTDPSRPRRIVQRLPRTPVRRWS